MMYDLFSDFFDGFDIFKTPNVYQEEKRCPVCGMTYSDFRRTGRLGCGACYETFKAPLTQILRQIHQNPVHAGKIPSKNGIKLKQKRQLEALKSQLSDAVKREDYESAAKLHKQIKEIEGGKEQ